METVFFEESGALPEQIKIVNEAYVVGPADGLEPAVKAENSAKASGTASKSGDRTGNEDRSVALFQKVKKVVEVSFGQFRLLTGSVICSHVNNNSDDGGGERWY